MKKNYSKPYLAVESFQLDAAIASSCSENGKVSLGHGMDTCTTFEEAPGLGYFGLACANGGGHDVINNPGSDGNDGFCYHGPIYQDMFMNS